MSTRARRVDGNVSSARLKEIVLFAHSTEFFVLRSREPASAELSAHVRRCFLDVLLTD